MLKVIVKNKNSSIDKINLIGHANYADYGKDIVCSAVSSIVTTTINGIISIDSDAITYEYYSDIMEINIIKHDDVTIKLINNMIDLLKSLSKDYPKNIKVKERK